MSTPATAPAPATRTAGVSVTDGVFFTAPPALPRGRHQLSRDIILAAQRERLMIAVTELMAEQGFRAVTVGAVAARAQVSPNAFYLNFPEGLVSCAFAAYERFIAVLVERITGAVDAVTAGGPPNMADLVSAVIESYLDTLRSDPVSALAFQIEMDAIGSEARTKRRQALTAIAELLHDAHAATGATSLMPHEAWIALVYGVRQIAADSLDTGTLMSGAAVPPLSDVLPWVSHLLGAPSASVANREK